MLFIGVVSFPSKMIKGDIHKGKSKLLFVYVHILQASYFNVMFSRFWDLVTFDFPYYFSIIMTQNWQCGYWFYVLVEDLMTGLQLFFGRCWCPFCILNWGCFAGSSLPKCSLVFKMCGISSSSQKYTTKIYCNNCKGQPHLQDGSTGFSVLAHNYPLLAFQCVSLLICSRYGGSHFNSPLSQYPFTVFVLGLHKLFCWELNLRTVWECTEIQ